ncbi:site-2 protease family protein [Flagellimonas allohymeniacidonis]|uniref:Zinc metalloprotease n=1 Tax=Flagellimonas allohymeniacidonis TaxID=2517819 RepID=A0A4Q8QGS2_9FLAO|nr:site-2 protease family protein [Allomuricauda hymeniacidonis]TAI48438.1 site-2 protease family protein [Allomuricauda hymeniacidonis]
MKGSLKLGKVSGIQIEVHWTFTLLLLWVAFIEVQRGGTAATILMNMVFIVVLFFCVVLHELGHALTAKRFQVNTKRITLLPIGGVASLEKIPEKPEQELLVALAGPAVNVVIALLLLLVVPLREYLSLDPESLDNLLNAGDFQNFLFFLFLANTMLVVFNLIPAFPMDGGRVFRALLSFKLGRVKATEVAAGLGQALAVLFFVLGLFLNPFLILIALFIFFGAFGENQMVKRSALLKGHLVQEAMLTDITLLNPETTVEEVINVVLKGTEKQFLVVDGDEVLGIVDHKTVLKHAKEAKRPVVEIMKKEVQEIEASAEVTKALELMAKGSTDFLAVTANGLLAGAIDRANIGEFILLQTNLSAE